MTETTAFRLLRNLASVRRTALGVRSGRGALALALRVASVAMLVWIGYIHLHLWQEGYRQIHILGPTFLLDAIAAFVLAAVLLAWPRPLVGLLSAGFSATTLGALLISLNFGLFGFRESTQASYVGESIWLEAIVTVLLLVWTVLAALPARAPGRRTDGRDRPTAAAPGDAVIR